MKIISVLYNVQKTGITKPNRFFVSSPIYYVNAAPHIGHLYSSVIADAIHRWHKLINPTCDSKFSTGTDEHGTKIQQSALKCDIPLETYCESISEKYKRLSQLYHVDYTDFVRTTDSSHKRAVHNFWKVLNGRGFIYKAKYQGWYCVSDETFLSDSQLKEIIGPDGKKKLVSAESGHPVEWTEESNYMFKLNQLKDDVKHWVSSEGRIKPKKFQKILLDVLNEDLPDLSVSRPSNRVHWAIRVPDNDEQSIYVWLDALVNYLSVTGYPDPKYKCHWPQDLNVIGKDILKFHGIYWPAFLIAAGLDPPTGILCHSHWTVDGEKMSKSKGNVVCPFDKSDVYTPDGLRYFLLREGVAHSDGNYSDVKVTRILNSELADTLGNLLNRCTAAIINPRQTFPAVEKKSLNSILNLDVTMNLVNSLTALPDTCYEHYSEYNFYKAVDATIATLHLANLFVEKMKPWELRKKEESLLELDVVLHIVLETLRVCGIVLSPIIPNLSQVLLNKINVPSNRRTWNSTSNISWRDGHWTAPPLAAEKVMLFRRILTKDEGKRKVGN